MRRAQWKVLAAGLVALLWAGALPRPASGQAILDLELDLDFDRPESWAMKRIGALALFTGMGVAEDRRPGSVEIAFEGLWIPRVSEEKATVGFNGIKTEDVNRLSVFGRPRVRVGLPWSWTLDASWVPPLGEIEGIEPHLLAVALERPVWRGARSRLGLRLAAQTGTIRGDITCTEAQAAAGPDLERNPFQCEAPSDDELTVRSASLELGLALPLGEPERWDPYVALIAAWMDLDLQVDALYSGIADTTRGFTDGWVPAATAGMRYRAGERLSIAGELFYSPLEVVRPPAVAARTDDLTHVRMLLSYRVR